MGNYTKRMKKTNIDGTKQNLAKQTIIQKFILIFFSGIFLLAPYLGGLYDDSKVLIFTFGTGVLAALVLIVRLGSNNNEDLTSVGLTALGLWYIISLFFAVSKGDAFLGTIRILSYLALYYTASKVLTPRAVRIGTYLFAFTSTVIILAGIGSSIGLPPIGGGWGNGIGSVFQYSNALGGFLLMAIPVTLLIYRDVKESWQRYLVSAVLYFEFLGFWGSQSRGSYVIMLIILPLALLAFRRDEILDLPMLFIIILAALNDWNLVAAAGNKGSYTVLLWPFAGLMPVLLSYWLFSKLKNRSRYRWGQISGILLVIVFLLIATFSPSAPHSSPANAEITPQLENAGVTQQIETINLGSETLQERWEFLKIAFQMSLTKPITGFGYNGWESAYRNFQGYLFNAIEPHSEPAKILVETGFPGLFFYALFGIGFLLKWINSWRERQMGMDYLIGVGALGVLIHSLMDIDLSESAIFYILLLMIASMGLDGKNTFSLRDRFFSKWNFGKFRLTTLIMIPVSVLLIILSPLQEAGLIASDAAKENLKKNKLTEALQGEQLALTLNPLQADTYLNIAEIKMIQGQVSNNQALLDQAVNDIERAMKLNTREPYLPYFAARVYEAGGRLEDAYLMAEKSLSLSSLEVKNYEHLAQYAVKLAEQRIENGDKAKAMPLLEKVATLPQRINERMSRVTEKQKQLWHVKPYLEATPLLNLYIGEALALAGNNETAIQTFTFLEDEPNLRSEALIWRGTLEKLQNNSRGDLDLKLVLNQNPQFEETQKHVQDLLLKTNEGVPSYH